MGDLRASASFRLQPNADAVFSAMTEPGNLRGWMNGVEKASWRSTEPPGLGSKIDVIYRYGRRKTEVLLEVTDFVPGELFGFATVSGPYPVRVKLDLAAEGDETQVTYTQIAIAGSPFTSLMFMLTGWLARPMTRKMLRGNLQRLGELLEAQARAPEQGD